MAAQGLAGIGHAGGGREFVVAVPGAYFLFNGAKFTGLKDTLINCGYPLIERFPLMLFTSAAVLLIGMARWYYAMWSSVRTHGLHRRNSSISLSLFFRRVRPHE